MLQDYSNIELKAELKRREMPQFEFVKTAMDFLRLEELAQTWMDCRLSPSYHEDNDDDHYLVEAIIKTFYGKTVYARLEKYDEIKGKA